MDHLQCQSASHDLVLTNSIENSALTGLPYPPSENLDLSENPPPIQLSNAGEYLHFPISKKDASHAFSSTDSYYNYAEQEHLLLLRGGPPVSINADSSDNSIASNNRATTSSYSATTSKSVKVRHPLSASTNQTELIEEPISDAYDYINDVYEEIFEDCDLKMSIKNEQSSPAASCRPLPVVSSDFYERLNLETGGSRATKSSCALRRVCIVFGKIMSIVAALVVTAVIAVTVVYKFGEDGSSVVTSQTKMTSSKPPLLTSTNLYLDVGRSMITFDSNTSVEVNETRTSMSDHDHSTAATPFLNDLRFEYVIRNVGVTLGITVLRSELFVLHSDPNLVNVYNFTHNFTHTRNITINGTSNDPDVHSLVSSQSNNCLYACSSASVYQYNLFDDVTTNWPVSGKCRGLSLASNDNVLVTVWDKERIEEYAHSGRWIREIRLERSIVHPSHSVQLSRGQFVVSHGFIDETIHRVCAVSEDVRIIKCAGDKKGSDTGQFDIPNSLAVDRHGRVLVADYTNNRVALLSRSLSHLGYVSIPGFEFERPWVLHLDELKRRLYVGEYTPTGRVFVLAV